jgi:PAS domain S-box-containing protein
MAQGEEAFPRSRVNASMTSYEGGPCIESAGAMVESERDYSAIVEQAKDAILIVIDGCVMFSNRGAQEITGYSPDEMRGMNYRTLVAPEFHDYVAELNRNRLAGFEVPAIYELQIKKKDGSLRDIEASSTIIDLRGRRTTMVLLRDITSRKMAERDLADSKRTMRALLNAIPDPMMLLDAQGRVITCNESAATRFEMDVDSLLGKCVFDLLPDDVAMKRRARREEILRIGKPFRFEDENNGTWFDNNIYPILDAQGNVESVAVYARDITKYRKTQEKLRARNQELKDFLYAVCHDMKTPLLNIEEFSSRLLENNQEFDFNETRHFLERIQANSGRAVDMILGLQKYAHYASRKKTHDLFDLGSLLMEIKADLMDRKEFASIGIVISEERTQFRGDRNVIYQIFFNLMENAAKYEGKRIDITWREESGFFLIDVQDDGIGIEEMMCDKIFELFTRSPRISQSTEGAGMGLAIVKKAVEDLGGTITVESQVDRGSTFHVRLPVSDSQ